MILVDTSVWIELLSPKRRPRLAERLLFLCATCGPVVQEVTQGLRPGPKSEAFRRSFLALPMLSDPLPMSIFEAAADIYRQGKARGITIRSSIDCLIAAIAIENGVPVWHRDRDFSTIARYTRIGIVEPFEL